MFQKSIIYHHVNLIILVFSLMGTINAIKTQNNSAAIVTLKSNHDTLILRHNKEFPATTTTDTTDWPEFPPKRHTKSAKVTTSTTTTSSPNFGIITTTSTFENSTDNRNGLEENKLNTLSYCFCDITSNSCDINCCCDPDCNVNILKVFQCTEEQQLPSPHQHKQHGIESCDTSDSWFCLYHSNVQIDEKNELNREFFDTTQFYTWPDPFILHDDNAERDFYKYGDPIQLINYQTKIIKAFELPSSHISSYYSPYCNSQEPVEHLKSFEKYCRIANIEELLEIQENLIQLNKFYSIETLPNLNKHELESVIPNIQVKYCYNGNKTCSSISNREEEKGDKIDEQFLLKKVNIKILHNYTQIKWCLLELWFKELDNIVSVEGEEEQGEKNLEEESELWLQWNVEFHNKTLEELIMMEEAGQGSYDKIISGPLGYLLNKPVIVSAYEEDPNLLSSHKMLKYFHKYTETSAHILTLFKTKHGKCYRPMDNANTINYGINEILSCTTIISNDSVITSTIMEQMANENDMEKFDFTGVCTKIQNLINYQLFGDDDDRITLNMDNIEHWFVSKLGRPQNKTTQWLPLIIKNSKSMPILGHYNQHINTFKCHNMLLNINYEFHVITKLLYEEDDTMPMMQTTQAQQIIERAALIFGQRHALEFTLNEQLEIPLVISTRFYNLNNENVFSRANTLITLSTFILGTFNALFESFIINHF